ncbi:flavodoxin family protein [Legionella israelensis]|nr:flavodoxin family protein [Legionella israelensis]
MDRPYNQFLFFFGILLFFYCPFSLANPLIFITYYPTSSTTEMAYAIAKGTQTIPGIDVKILPIDKAHFNNVKNANGIIIGSPVYNANVAPQVQQFINTWPLNVSSYREKVGAAFVVGAGISAGEEGTQMNLIRAMMIFNFIIVGGPNWRQPFGASAITHNKLIKKESEQQHLNPEFLKRGEALGRRVAEVVLRLHNSKYHEKHKETI